MRSKLESTQPFWLCPWSEYPTTECNLNHTVCAKYFFFYTKQNSVWIRHMLQISNEVWNFFTEKALSDSFFISQLLIRRKKKVMEFSKKKTQKTIKLDFRTVSRIFKCWTILINARIYEHYQIKTLQRNQV